MRSIEELEEFYQQDLVYDLQEIDVIRKKIVKLLLTVFTVLLAVSGASFLLAYFDIVKESDQSILIIGNIILIIAGVVYAVLNIRKYRYKTIFKQKIIKPIVQFISDDLRYYPKRKVSQQDFKNSRLFLKRIDRYKGDDFVEGKIDKTVFHFSEIHAKYKTTSTDSKGNKKTKWHTIFKGLFFVADFNKAFEGSTVLMPNYFGGGFSFIKKLAGVTRREKMISLQDPEFTENFNCYSDDDIKARYILSPALMHRINQFKENYPDNPVFISFVDGRIYVAIKYKKDLFEPSYFSSVVRFEKVQEYFEDIKFAVDIVEELNLNTRIWSKE